MNFNYKKLMPLIPVGVIVVAGASFAGGMQVQKRLGATATSRTAANDRDRSGAGGQRGTGGGFGGGMRQGGRPTFGTVASVEGSTLKVTSSMTGDTVTVALSGSTKITDDDGSIKTASDISTGDTVVVLGTAGSDGTVAATQVRLNPSQTGPMSGAAPGTTSSGMSSGSSNSFVDGSNGI